MIGILLPLVLRLGVPQRFARKVAGGILIALAAVLLIGGFMLWLHLHTKAAVEADRSASKAEALSNAREADERAERAGNRQIEEVEDGNERARDAARGSDDPLGDGLRSLRAEKDRDGQAAGGADRVR